jgi:phage shock protein A
MCLAVLLWCAELCVECLSVERPTDKGQQQLQQQLTELTAEVRSLRQKITQLEARLGRYKVQSSRSNSQDGLSFRERSFSKGQF